MTISSGAGALSGTLNRREDLPRPIVTLPAKAQALLAPGREHSNSVDFVQDSPTGENALTEALRELATRLLEASTKPAAAGPHPDAGSQEQLTFSFFAEVRSEALVSFQQRTQRVSEGLNGARQQNLVETSRAVAARFEFSLSVSVSVLQGFSDGAESLGNTDELDDFLELTKRLLGELDGVLSEFFDEISGLFSLGEDAHKFLDDISTAYGKLQDVVTQGTSFASLQLEFEFSFSASVTVEVQESDPIVLDLDGDGIELTNYRDGALFDITASGRIVQTAFVTGGDAFLALDRNANGVIDDGSELFGDQRGAINGFEELRKLDDNGDSRIDRFDAAYELLRLFRDNGNGRTEAGELLTLAQAGVESISLDYLQVDQRASGNNRIAQVAAFTANGRQGTAADAILNYLA